MDLSLLFLTELKTSQTQRRNDDVRAPNKNNIIGQTRLDFNTPQVPQIRFKALTKPNPTCRGQFF